MSKIFFAGPTLFAPMLKFWNNMVTFEVERNSARYYTFLILTDGVVNDIDDTIEEVVRSSFLPVSIIIIGIGDADFSNMRFLDSDEQPLFSRKSKSFCKRDNVQFVEFNKFRHDLQLLAKETLMELPKQLVDHFTSNNIHPEDLSVSHSNQEAKDFFSYQAMSFMTNDKFQEDYESIQQIVVQGIADCSIINLNKCMNGYSNNLSCQ